MATPGSQSSWAPFGMNLNHTVFMLILCLPLCTKCMKSDWMDEHPWRHLPTACGVCVTWCQGCDRGKPWPKPAVYVTITTPCPQTCKHPHSPRECPRIWAQSDCIGNECTAGTGNDYRGSRGYEYSPVKGTLVSVEIVASWPGSRASPTPGTRVLGRGISQGLSVWWDRMHELYPLELSEQQTLRLLILSNSWMGETWLYLLSVLKYENCCREKPWYA